MSPEPTPFFDVKSQWVSAADRQVNVQDYCWACGKRFTQNVLLEGAGRYELHWQCDSCDVSWTAIGSHLGHT